MTPRQQRISDRLEVMRRVIEFIDAQRFRVATRQAILDGVPGSTIVSISQMVRNEQIERADLADEIRYHATDHGRQRVGLPMLSAPSQRHVPRERYDGAELAPSTARSGALDAMRLPSVSFGRLVDRSGRPYESERAA